MKTGEFRPGPATVRWKNNMIIKNATLIDMKDIYKKRMNIIIRDGRIAGITASCEELEDSEIIDAGGAVVTPGFVETHCSVGIKNQVHRMEGNDGDDADPVCPQLRAIDALDFGDEGFGMARKGGVTTVVTGPGTSCLIGGTFAAVKTAGRGYADRVVKEEAAIHFSLCNEPRMKYGRKGRSPQTRMGSAALIREALYQAGEYKRRVDAGGRGDMNLAHHSLMRVFDGMPVKMTAFQANDMETCIRLGQEFGLNYTIEGAYDAVQVCEDMECADYRFAVGPLYGGGQGREEKNRKLSLGGELEKRGIHPALTTWHPKMSIELFSCQLAMAHSQGMSEAEVLKAATIYPAAYAGLEDRVGSIEYGKDADLLIWDGEPLDYYGRVRTMVIGGVVVAGEV